MDQTEDTFSRGRIGSTSRVFHKLDLSVEELDGEAGVGSHKLYSWATYINKLCKFGYKGFRYSIRLIFTEVILLI